MLYNHSHSNTQIIIFQRYIPNTNYMWHKLHTFFLRTMEETISLKSHIITYIVFTWWNPFYSVPRWSPIVFMKNKKINLYFDAFYRSIKIVVPLLHSYFEHQYKMLRNKKTELSYAHLIKEKMMNHSLIK